MNKFTSPISRILIALMMIILIASTAVVTMRPLRSTTTGTQAAGVQKKYVCSMHPQVVQDKPGDCPLCGMALIERIDRDDNSADTVLNKVVRPVNEAVLASVQTVSPGKEELPLTIEAAGIINFDSRRISTISARFGGLIEKSYVKYPFQPIHKGQKIFEIYSPEIYANKINYIQLIRTFPDQKERSQDARDWLENLGLTKEQIDQIIREPALNYHLSVYSDGEGYAVSSNFSPEQYYDTETNQKPGIASYSNSTADIGLREGTVIEAGAPLFKIINTASIRADLKIRTEDAGLLRTGQNVMLTDAILPERNLNATVSQIEPLNGGLFQLVKVYITDRQMQLIPGRQIQARIRAGNHSGLWIPRTAVINLGQHQAVFLMRDNTFIVTRITTGLQSGDMIEIRNGITTSDKIALHASLLTDSDGFIKTN